jgi:hypothetical protein
MYSIQFHVKGYASFLMKQTIYLSVIDFLTHNKVCVDMWMCGFCRYKPGNPGLLIRQAGLASPPQAIPKANIGIIVGAIIGGILVFAMIAFVIMWYGRLPTFGIGINIDLEGE